MISPVNLKKKKKKAKANLIPISIKKQKQTRCSHSVALALNPHPLFRPCPLYVQPWPCLPLPLELELQSPLKFYPGWKWIHETQGTNFEFVKLVKIQLIPSSGITYFIQFEAKPGSTEYTLKTFEGSMFEDYVHPTNSWWPRSCKLLGPNSQRYVCPPQPGVWTIPTKNC
ncbi:hypothetical protein CFP56_026362 [Quercus suber]|uniref:Uncharacterized protein n=1 Tax=Quercus suber TaxID=58331 RepID=A0AAW0K0D6_QUESU